MPRTAMSPDDRHQIVVLTSAFHGYSSHAAPPPHKTLAASTNLNATKVATIATSPPLLVGASIALVSDQVSVANRPQLDLSMLVPGLGNALRLSNDYLPLPFEAEQLMLSPLGGWLRSRGAWEPPYVSAAAPPPPPHDFRKLLVELGPLARLAKTAALAESSRVATTLAAAEHAVSVKPIEKPIEFTSPFQLLPGLLILTKPEGGRLDLSEWVHRAAQGRDHYVRIVYEGELWPFRHKAALVKVTERKFEVLSDGRVGAYLLQRLFIVVREPEKSFDDAANRGSPFRKVRLTTLVTPDIADPSIIKEGQKTTNRSFWVEVMTGTTTRDRFRFHAVGVDKNGDAVDFTMPLMFVSVSDLPDADPDATRLVARAYNGSKPADAAARAAALFGSKLAFAPQDPAEPSDNTRLVTDALSFVVDKTAGLAKLLKADVRIPQVQELLGQDATTAIRYFEDFVTGNFDAQTGVFASVVGALPSALTPDNPFADLGPAKLDVGFSADQAGGFATPNLGVSMLTRKLGPLAGAIGNAVQDHFDPSDFFPKGGLAKLFGSFELADLLLPQLSSTKNAPKLKTTKAGGKLVTTLDWQPAIQDVDFGVAKFMPQAGSTLIITGRIEKPLDAATLPTSSLSGSLKSFKVSVLDSVTINFVSFAFSAKNGAKPDVKVDLDTGKPLEFSGDLSFVEALRDAIPPGLFGDGPSLDISPLGIRAGFAFALPPIAVGVFALKDVSLGAALTLPFLDGKPSFDFNVSERAHPFQLTVSLFGGGGFFHLQLDTLGIKLLEASFEFGAAAAIDIGIASGEVHIMAGIYFSMQRKETGTSMECTLTGYLRMGGSLSVLGIVHISVEFNLSFTYRDTDKAYGTATLTVHVEVLFFSKDVSLTVEKQFSGSSSDPTFFEMVDAPAWNTYALAFA